MVSSGATPQVEHLDLSDDDTEALFASPSRPETKPRAKSIKTEDKEVTGQQSRTSESVESDSEEAREAALRKELAGIRNINQVIEGVVDSLERARGNMDTVSRTVNDASTLLNTWTRILSQTEHNQRLILDPSWHGATQDLADTENESLLKQQEKERSELEELQRREARARKAEEEEKRRLESAGTKAVQRLQSGPAVRELLELGVVSAEEPEVAQEEHEKSGGIRCSLALNTKDPTFATTVRWIEAVTKLHSARDILGRLPRLLPKLIIAHGFQVRTLYNRLVYRVI
ncbi:MAG: hypothetical protein Q9169_004936 [Polycauliona sp. 2 TL-2023]